MQKTIVHFEASYYDGLFKLDNFYDFMEHVLRNEYNAISTGTIFPTISTRKGQITRAVYHIEPQGVTLHYQSTWNGDKRGITVELFGNQNTVSDIERMILEAASQDKETASLPSMKDKLEAFKVIKS
ncbi:MAG: hypothetical protein AABX72_02140 [Nanoarchaeota archaeon]